MSQIIFQRSKKHAVSQSQQRGAQQIRNFGRATRIWRDKWCRFGTPRRRRALQLLEFKPHKKYIKPRRVDGFTQKGTVTFYDRWGMLPGVIQPDDASPPIRFERRKSLINCDYVLMGDRVEFSPDIIHHGVRAYDVALLDENLVPLRKGKHGASQIPAPFYGGDKLYKFEAEWRHWERDKQRFEWHESDDEVEDYDYMVKAEKRKEAIKARRMEFGKDMK